MVHDPPPRRCGGRCRGLGLGRCGLGRCGLGRGRCGLGRCGAGRCGCGLGDTLMDLWTIILQGVYCDMFTYTNK